MQCEVKHNPTHPGKALYTAFHRVSYGLYLGRSHMHDAKRTSSSARRTTRIVAFSLVLASAFASGSLLAGGSPPNVRGRVAGWDRLLPQVYAQAANDPHRYTWREPSPTVKQDFRKLSANVSRDVCVAAFGSGRREPVDISERRSPTKVTGWAAFTPQTCWSPTAWRSRISFKNDDPVPHQLFEVSNAAWAPNPTGPGSSREWAAGAPGLHEIRDQLFPSIVLYIVVDAQVVEFATPDRDGAFSMALPSGDYTLKAFFDGKPAGQTGSTGSTSTPAARTSRSP